MKNPSRSAGQRPEPPLFADNPFLEILYDSVCRELHVLPGEDFVEQVRRWCNALRVMDDLKPRTRHEWFLAADVTIKQFDALHSLIEYQRESPKSRTRMKSGMAFVAKTKTMQDALNHYESLRKASDSA